MSTTDTTSPNVEQPDSKPELSNRATLTLNAFCQHLTTEKQYTGSTTKQYGSHVESFLRYFEKKVEAFNPTRITTKHLSDYFNYAQTKQRRSMATLEARHNALELFFAWLLKKGVINSNPMTTVAIPKKKPRKGVTYPVRRTVRLTSEMANKLISLAQGDEELSDVIRRALRFFLDEQQDLIGSRKAFSHKLIERMDEMMVTMIWHFMLLQIQNADTSALIFANLVNIPPGEESKFDTGAFIKQAQTFLLKFGERLQELNAQAIHDAQMNAQIRTYNAVMDEDQAKQRKRK
jgi:hypothetical protein